MAISGAAERTVLGSCIMLLGWLRRGQLGGHLRAWRDLRRAARRLRASAAFDADWYRATYPDVAASRADPALHYLRWGAAEGRAPLPVAIPPLPGLALTEAGYRGWVAADDAQAPGRLAEARTAIEHLVWRPAIGIALFGCDRASEAMTMASLEAQLYLDWCLTDAPCGDVTLFLPVGTVLARTALLRIAVAVAAAPSIELIYADEDRLDSVGRRIKPWFKPSADPVLLAECDLIGVTGAYRRRLLDRLGVTGVTDCLALREVARRAVSAVAPNAVMHIPNILFHVRDETATPATTVKPATTFTMLTTVIAVTTVTTITPSPPATPTLSPWPVGVALGRLIRRLTRPFERRRYRTDGRVHLGHDDASTNGATTIDERLPLVSIIIPTRDRTGFLERCVDGLLHRTDYRPIEVLIVDNESRERRTARLLTRLATDPRVRILRHPGPFNWSAMNNAAVRQARGEIVVLLNNDTDVINPAWLHEMVTLTQQADTGIVGARLLYPDGTLQHAGMTIGPGAIAAHLCRGAARNDPGHGGMLRHSRTVAAVTGACMVMRREVFDAVGGLETEHLAITNNDLDLCLRVRARGWRVVCTPRAELYHHDAATRGPDLGAEKLDRVRRERAYLIHRWGALAQHDPTLNPNLATVNGQLVLVASIASPGSSIQGEWRGDSRDAGEQIRRQAGGRERDAADVQRVG